MITNAISTIENSKFIKNKAVDEYTEDPSFIYRDYKPGYGGALVIGKEKTTINNIIFKDNNALQSGGAMVVYGIKRDRGIEDFADEIGINEDLHVDISNNTEFVNNIERQVQVERYL